MPPITSRRPGARAIAMGEAASKKRLRVSVSIKVERSIWFSLQPSAFPQSVLQQHLHLLSNRCVRVTHPRDVGGHIQRGIQRTAGRVGDDDSELFCDERRAQVIRMTTQVSVSGLLCQQGLEQRPEIGYETVVTSHEFIK